MITRTVFNALVDLRSALERAGRETEIDSYSPQYNLYDIVNEAIDREKVRDARRV